MKEQFGFRKLLLGAMVVLLPMVANANFIITTGSIAAGGVNYHPFEVTGQGNFFTIVFSSFENI